ncbi:excisionase [Aquabacterium sp.]|uniref:excisionase n=1 Tax=Aquabacterium sp. TaxID=1872578 RepID=UPI003783D68F
MAKKILLLEWASRRYDPPPPLFTLRRWAREGEIQPPPELVGKAYYVLENAERIGVPDPDYSTLVERLKAIKK